MIPASVKVLQGTNKHTIEALGYVHTHFGCAFGVNTRENPRNWIFTHIDPQKRARYARFERTQYVVCTYPYNAFLCKFTGFLNN